MRKEAVASIRKTTTLTPKNDRGQKTIEEIKHWESKVNELETNIKALNEELKAKRKELEYANRQLYDCKHRDN